MGYKKKPHGWKELLESSITEGMNLSSTNARLIEAFGGGIEVSRAAFQRHKKNITGGRKIVVDPLNEKATDKVISLVVWLTDNQGWGADEIRQFVGDEALSYQEEKERRAGFFKGLSSASRRNFGNKELVPIPLGSDKHHIDNFTVVPIPTEIHRSFSGTDRPTHRQEVMKWIEENDKDLYIKCCSYFELTSREELC